MHQLSAFRWKWTLWWGPLRDPQRQIGRKCWWQRSTTGRVTATVSQPVDGSSSGVLNIIQIIFHRFRISMREQTVPFRYDNRRASKRNAGSQWEFSIWLRLMLCFVRVRIYIVIMETWSVDGSGLDARSHTHTNFRNCQCAVSAMHRCIRRMVQHAVKCLTIMQKNVVYLQLSWFVWLILTLVRHCILHQLGCWSPVPGRRWRPICTKSGKEYGKISLNSVILTRQWWRNDRLIGKSWPVDTIAVE